MLYVYHGTNTTKVSDQASRLVANLLNKKPDAQVFSFEGGNMAEADLDALIEAQGLFVEKHIVVIKRPLVVVESRDIVLARLEQFAKTSNIFVIIEDKLLAEHKKAFTKHAEKIEEHAHTKEEKAFFNVFALADALGERNKQSLWVGYMQALHAGLEAESIHGTLHWAVKAMLACGSASSAEEAGQKPYSFNKFKRFANNFSKEELADLSQSLVVLYHDARRGKHDLKVALERWTLSV